MTPEERQRWKLKTLGIHYGGACYTIQHPVTKSQPPRATLYPMITWVMSQRKWVPILRSKPSGRRGKSRSRTGGPHTHIHYVVYPYSAWERVIVKRAVATLERDE